MLRIKVLLVTLTTVLISCGGSGVEEFTPPANPSDPEEPTEKIVYHERAKALFDLINQYYQVKNGPTRGLYNENYPKQAGDLSASFLWPYDGLVSGAANLYALGYDFDYKGMVDRFELYWRTSGDVNIGGYGSQTNGVSGSGTRFYDDNSIVGIDLVHAYKLTGDQTYLERAKRIVSFLKSGEDNVHGGGLWWNESQKNQAGVGDSNKPACANGYATLFLLEYYHVCASEEKSDVLAFAKRLYNWLYTNLRDPEDNNYWNDKQVNGAINKTKWTYNTGVMISNGVRLYRITGDEKYLDHAKASAEGAYNYFVRPANGMALAYPANDPWFTIKLINAFVDILPYYKTAQNYIDTFINFTDHAYEKARNQTGFFYEDWTGGSPKRIESLLMQAAALDGLSLIALYKGEVAGQ